jgi:hypothetical protein
MLNSEALVHNPNSLVDTSSDLLDLFVWPVRLESYSETVNRQISGATLWQTERGHNPFLETAV